MTLRHIRSPAMIPIVAATTSSFKNLTLCLHQPSLLFYLIFPKPPLKVTRKQKELLPHCQSILLTRGRPRGRHQGSPTMYSWSDSEQQSWLPPNLPALSSPQSRSCLSLNWKLPLGQQMVGEVSRKRSPYLLIQRKELFCLA